MVFLALDWKLFGKQFLKRIKPIGKAIGKQSLRGRSRKMDSTARSALPRFELIIASTAMLRGHD